MSIVRELVAIVLAGTLGFLGAIAYLLGAILVWICALESAVCLIGVLFCLAGWLLLDSRDGFLAMLKFVAWGAVPFTTMVAILYCRDKLADALAKPRRPHRVPRHVARHAPPSPEDEPFIPAPRFELRVTRSPRDGLG